VYRVSVIFEGLGVDCKNVNASKPKQEMNDRPSSLLDGDGELSVAKTRNQVHKPAMQCLWLLLEGVMFHPFGVSGFQANGMLLATPVQANPGCIINAFGFHVHSPCLFASTRALVRRNPYGKVL
jgi:hypothetical protein